MKFLVDAQLPPVLAGWLQQAGHEADHVEDLGLRNAHDIEIWSYALKTGAAIMTKDEDFAVRTQQTGGGPVSVWLRIGNVTNHPFRAWIEPRLAGIVKFVGQGSRRIEVV